MSYSEEDVKTKYQDFMTWLSNNPQKKKELANIFDNQYKILDNIKKQQSSDLSIEQLLINTLHCVEAESQSDEQVNTIKCNYDEKHLYNNDYKGSIHTLFIYWTDKFEEPYGNNEELFEMIKDQMHAYKLSKPQ